LIVWIDDRLVALGSDATSDVRLALATVPTPVEYFAELPELGDARFERLARACASLGYPTIDAFNLRALEALDALAGPAALVVVPTGEPRSAMAGLQGVAPAAVADPGDESLDHASWVVAPWAINQHSPIVSVRLFVDAERTRGHRYAAAHGAAHCAWENTNGRLARIDDATVVVERDRQLLTPALAAGALDDMWRSRLLTTDVVREAALAVADLDTHPAAIVTPRGTMTLLAGADESAFEALHRALERR
jgi:branched-subunit amino acid aminotransferase/4-amino-4-deoxychorismate lyase